MRKLILAAIALVAFTVSAHAEDKPLFAKERLSAAFGIDHSFYSGSDNGSAYQPKSEWEVGPVAAYNLLATDSHRPLLSLTASVMYGIDSEIVRTKIGVRLIVFNGGN